MKLATWNVDKPVSSARRDTMLGFIREQKADVWALTEAHELLSLGDDYHDISSLGGRDVSTWPDKHHWVTIWSRDKLTRIPTSDDRRTAAALVTPKLGEPYVVFGTVLPWGTDKRPGHPINWRDAYQDALSVQVADWKGIQSKYSDCEFFLMGDFNQQMVGAPHYYGSSANREALDRALNEAHLKSLTAYEHDPIRRHFKPRANIDHICAKTNSGYSVEATQCWPMDSEPRKQGRSDHYGISANLVPKQRI